MGEYVVPLHISSFLVRWSSLKEFVPSWHFIHSVLATGVKCFHVVPRRSQEKLNKRIGSHIHSNIKAGRQTHAVLDVGGGFFPTLVPHLGSHPAVWGNGNAWWKLRKDRDEEKENF